MLKKKRKSPQTNNYSNILVIPARGGMGRNVESQANMLAANLAHKLNGSYKLLHIPENVSAEVLSGLLKERQVKEVIDLIPKANILIYGIGNAIHMAKKRGTAEENIEKLIELGAVGEAFGCYFDENSNAKFPPVAFNALIPWTCWLLFFVAVPP